MVQIYRPIRTPDGADMVEVTAAYSAHGKRYVLLGEYMDVEKRAYALEQRCKELEDENALLRKRLEPIEAAYKEYKEYPLSAIVKRDAYNQAINRCMEIGEGK